MDSRDFRRPESVIVVLHDPRGRMLLLKRADIPDFWQSVTGSLEWDETPRQTAIREIFEETGIDRVSGLRDWRRSRRFEILPQYRDRYRPGTRYNREHMFSMQIPADCRVILNPGEHSACQWQWPARAREIVWSYTNRDAIDRVAAEL